MTRRERLTEAGYDYDDVQSIVNSLVYDRENAGGTVEDTSEPVAEAPIDGRFLAVEVDLSTYDGIKVTIL